MRKFFENPEMMINVFDNENVVTTLSNLNPTAAKDALGNDLITLDGKSGTNVAKATQIFSFKEIQ